jgi:hypothetical protein
MMFGFHAVTVKNAVFWDVAHCLLLQGRRNNASQGATCSSESSVYNKFTQHHIPEDGILQNYNQL